MTVVVPEIPQTVIRWVGETAPRIIPNFAQVVAVPIVDDWGPLGSDPPGADGLQGGPQLLLNFQQYLDRFGDSDTAGRTAVAGAFAGQGLPGAAGAGGVVAYRAASSAAASSTVTIQDRQGSPEDALKLDGKYVGARGNNISVIIDADPADGTRDRLRILYNGGVRETFLYAQSAVAALVTAINARSSLVKATNLESTPQRLAATAGTPLTAGNSGTSLSSGDHISALDALEFATFGILAPYDLTDDSILASYVSWVVEQKEANRPVRMVCGGAANDTIDDAIARSGACAEEHVTNLGVGVYHDDLLAKDLTTSQLAPRVAGILAARGQKSSLTAARIGGLHSVSGPTTDEIKSGIQGGVVNLMRISASDAEIRLSKGVSTFTATDDADRPYDVFSDSRLIGIMDNYVRRVKQWGDEKVIGDLPVNQDTRDSLYAEARRLEDELLTQGLILPGDDVTIPKPYVVVPETADDTLPYTFGWQFAKTANAILGEGHIR